MLAAEESRLLSNGSCGHDPFEALVRAIVDGMDSTTHRLAAMALRECLADSSSRPAKSSKSIALPPPSIHWEDGAIAVLRRGWHCDDPRLAVLFAGQYCQLELVASGNAAVSGAWRFEVSQQGRPLEALTPWESICWYTDDEVIIWSWRSS